MQFTGVIKRITNYKREGGIVFYVSSKDAKAKRDEYGQVRCVCKNRRFLFPSLTAEFTGKYVDGYIYVREIKPTFFNDTATITYLMKRFKGLNIKRGTIAKIVDKYGAKIFTFDRETFLNNLNTDFDELGETIDKIITELYDPRPIDVIAEYFERFEYEESVIRRIYETYGSTAVEEFKKDPYLASFNTGLSLLHADMIAFKEGFTGLDRRRIEGYIRYKLEKSENDGNTYAVGYELLEDVLNEFDERHLVYKDTVVYAVDIANVLVDSKYFVLTDDGKISFKDTYRAEDKCAKRLKDLLTSDFDKYDITDEDIKKKEEEYGITLGNSQRAAVLSSGSNNIMILTGGAGTGKTSTVRIITDLYEEKVGGTICFCAPTGRAAKRLSDSIYPRKASTIHHLLEMRPGLSEAELTYNQNNPLDADFIIVDEMSMVGVKLFECLLSAVKNGTKLMLVGDENQLPSVEAGNCLHDIIASDIVPVSRLTDIYRQGENSGIVVNSVKVLAGENIDDNYDDFEVIRADTNDEARDIVDNLFKKHYNISKPYDTQIIEPTNVAVSNTNSYAHAYVMGKRRDARRIDVGDKIMFSQNASQLAYVNGEFGIVGYIGNDLVSIISEEGVQKDISIDAFHEECRLAYSVTIHKMQGSEAETIIIHLPDGCSRMMNKKLLYTAITRAQSKVIIVSVDGSINDCINTEYKERKTRLCDMLIEN